MNCCYDVWCMYRAVCWNTAFPIKNLKQDKNYQSKWMITKIPKSLKCPTSSFSTEKPLLNS